MSTANIVARPRHQRTVRTNGHAGALLPAAAGSVSNDGELAIASVLAEPVAARAAIRAGMRATVRSDTRAAIS